MGLSFSGEPTMTQLIRTACGKTKCNVTQRIKRLLVILKEKGDPSVY